MAQGLGPGVLTPAGTRPASGLLRGKLAAPLIWESTRPRPGPVGCGLLRVGIPRDPPLLSLQPPGAVVGPFREVLGGQLPEPHLTRKRAHAPHQGDQLSEARREGYFWAGDVVCMLPCHHKASRLVCTHRCASATSSRSQPAPRGDHSSHLGLSWECGQSGSLPVFLPQGKLG